jgi:CRP/FNR family transcriptional regulator, cyclic AMP receptor protein
MTDVAPPQQALSVHLLRLAQQGQLRHFSADTLILCEDEKSDAFYILLQGQVRVFRSDLKGKAISYGTISAGEYFGEMALDGGTRSANVQAVTQCQCAVVPNLDVLAYLEQHSGFAIELLHKVIDRARKATQTASDLALRNVYSRLAQTLMDMASHHEGVCAISPKPAQVMLASHVGASREMVTRLMKDLERGGYVQVEKGRLVLLKKLPSQW